MTASTDIVIRPSALPALAQPMVARTTAMDPFLAADITEALVAMETARARWEQQVSDSIPCTSLDEEVWVDEGCDWVSPMAGHPQPPVVMDWAGLDWSRSRGGAA